MTTKTTHRPPGRPRLAPALLRSHEFPLWITASLAARWRALPAATRRAGLAKLRDRLANFVTAHERASPTD